MPDAPVAIVTASSGPVALAIAEALAGDGMDIVMNDATPDDAIDDHTLTRLREEYCVHVVRVEADMSRPEQVRRMVESTLQRLGRVDVLVNNAAILSTAPIHRMDAADWDAILAVNLSAAFHSIAAVLPHMLERNWGRIVNVACIHGLMGATDRAAYVAARHGVVGLTKAVALETAATGITCNAICPSLDVAAPRQIGALASFLCSEDAAQIRGVALPIDAGLPAQ